MFLDDEDDSGAQLGFIDPVTLGVGGSILAATAPVLADVFGKKDTSAKDAAKIARKMEQERAYAMVTQAEQNKRLVGGAVIIGGAVLITALLIWGATRKRG